MEPQIIDSAPLNYQNDDPQPGFLQKLQLHLFTSDLSPKQGVICQNFFPHLKIHPKLSQFHIMLPGVVRFSNLRLFQKGFTK